MQSDLQSSLSAEAPLPAATTASSTDTFKPYEPVTLIDFKNRRSLVFPAPDSRIQVCNGYIETNILLAATPGSRFRTSKGQIVVAYRSTLEEYVLLMPRAATVIPPKDMAFMIQWADVFPGALVVEGGVGSGALALGLLRAIGEQGKVISFELREDHANRARKNIAAWPGSRADRIEIRLGDLYQDLGTVRGVDRILLDVPEPHMALPGAAQALKPGGLIVSYVPTIRQIDTFVLAVLDHPDFAEPEVVEVMVRPWAADRMRLRPELRIVGHSGFLVRARKRGAILPGVPGRTLDETGARGEVLAPELDVTSGEENVAGTAAEDTAEIDPPSE